MDIIISIILSVVAVLLAAVALYKISSLSNRLHRLREKYNSLENQLGKGPRNQPQENSRRPERERAPKPQGQTPRERPEPQPREQQSREPRQKQAREPQNPDQARGRQGQPANPNAPQQPRQQNQPRQGQQPTAAQPGQPSQGQRNNPPQNQPRQGQQPRAAAPDGNEQPTAPQQPQKKRREPQAPRDPMQNQDGQIPQNRPRQNQPTSLGTDLVGSDLLSELTNQAPEPAPQEPQSRTAFAIIPEDGVIKQHQLQQKPDSDSYLEIDTPAETNSNSTAYRFNLSGNQAFVISQGMDRLENAFSFEKPTNRQVNQIVQQGDGILTRVGNGWRIERKARIDFR